MDCRPHPFGRGGRDPVIATLSKEARRLVQNFALKSEFTVDEEVPLGERRAVAYVGASPLIDVRSK